MKSVNISPLLFNLINKGPAIEPRRLKFAKNIKIIKDKLDSTWLDLGAGDGTYLKFLSENSIGLDVRENLDKKIFRWNFNSEIPVQYRNKFDLVWCSNLMEHVLRPHEFLLSIKNFLAPGGLVIISCPNTLPRNPLIFRGTYFGDHVNFFNLTTLKLTIKYSGYEILHTCTPSFGRFLSKFAFIAPTIMVVARPIENFQYPESAHKLLDSNQQIVFKDENFGH